LTPGNANLGQGASQGSQGLTKNFIAHDLRETTDGAGSAGNEEIGTTYGHLPAPKL